MKIVLKIGVFSSFLLLSFACSRNVTRVESTEVIDLSGRWNDTDSRMVAEEMSKDALNSPWLKEIELNEINPKRPVIIVGTINNKTSEHIESSTFIADVEREFIKTTKIRVVENKVFREKLREERADQQEFAAPETQKKWGKELGADFMLFGEINATIDQLGSRKVIAYQVNLELINIETNEKVWIGDKKIKKYVRN